MFPSACDVAPCLLDDPGSAVIPFWDGRDASMLTQSARRIGSDQGRKRAFAVLLNGNARQVDDETRRALASVVPEEDLFLSRSLADARRIADTVISRGYGTVFTGGGDGTFVGWVNQILDRAERRRATPPRFGVLALGTGNAVAGVVGARTDAHVENLTAFARGETTRLRRLDLLVCDGRRTPFAGVGIDAAVLNDYRWLKSHLEKTRLSRAALGVPGYALAIGLRSAPRYLVERRPSYCEIVNVGGPAFRLDGRGHQIGPAIQHGELLYAGACTMAAASTVPFYGFGLKAFPYACSRPGAMQLRVLTELSLATLLVNLPSIWSGEFAHPGVVDFHAERVSLQFERPVPLQVGGDAEGWRDEVTFGMAPRPVDLLDFTPAPPRPRLVN
jgi:diacylglycerol kinase family enzyme